MQMQAIKQNSDENQANASDMQRKAKVGAENDAMQATCKGKQRWARKTMQMQAKTDAGMQNSACNANVEAMNAMQCFRWTYLEDLRPDLR